MAKAAVFTKRIFADVVVIVLAFALITMMMKTMTHLVTLLPQIVSVGHINGQRSWVSGCMCRTVAANLNSLR